MGNNNEITSKISSMRRVINGSGSANKSSASNWILSESPTGRSIDEIKQIANAKKGTASNAKPKATTSNTSKVSDIRVETNTTKKSIVNQEHSGRFFGSQNHNDYYGRSATDVIACDPEELVSEAIKIQKLGEELNDLFKYIYQKVASLYDSWYGKSYSKVCKDFNKIVSDINKMLNFTISEIPDALVKIATSFAEADGRSVNHTFAKESPNSVTLLNTKETEGFRFLTAAVEAVKNDIPEKIAKAEQNMDQIIKILDKLSWNGYSSTTFSTRFTAISNKLKANFDDVIARFNTHFNEQVENVKRIEAGNMFT